MEQLTDTKPQGGIDVLPVWVEDTLRQQRKTQNNRVAVFALSVKT